MLRVNYFMALGPGRNKVKGIQVRKDQHTNYVWDDNHGQDDQSRIIKENIT